DKLSGNEKRLYRVARRYFENFESEKWNVNQFLEFTNRKGGDKFPLTTRKEIYTMWLEYYLQKKTITVKKYLDLLNEAKYTSLAEALSFQFAMRKSVDVKLLDNRRQNYSSFIKTGKSNNSYVRNKDYIKDDVPHEIKILLRLELEKNISENDEAGYIYVFTVEDKEKENRNSSRMFYKIGRCKNVDQRLKQWEKKCDYKAKLLESFPTEGCKCKYTHRVERLIHLELSKTKATLPPCPGCKEVHQEWFKGESISDSKMPGWKEIRAVIVKWVTYAENVYGPGL
ncbi:22530_t:CDS:2, partial [Cetraspora pellucida]